MLDIRALSECERSDIISQAMAGRLPYRKFAFFNNDSFIALAYIAALARAPDTSGCQNYLTELNTGRHSLDVIDTLLKSTEGLKIGRSIPGIRWEKFKYQARSLVGAISRQAAISKASMGALIKQRELLSDALIDEDRLMHLTIAHRISESESAITVDSSITTSSPTRAPDNAGTISGEIAAEFDTAFYEESYSDIRRHGIDAFEHFMTYGWRENRDPAPWFSTARYLAEYPDVTLNPFEHYITIGRKQGRRAPRSVVNFPYDTVFVRNISVVGDAALSDLNQYLPVSLRGKDSVSDGSRLEIHWVIPDFARGGGGHLTIFRMVRWLEQFNHTNYIWINRPTLHRSETDAFDDIQKYFMGIVATVRFIDEHFLETSGDCIIATSWDTVAPARAAAKFNARLYFVQDFEPSFFPLGSHYYAAESTYRHKDLGYICASPWLARLMTDRYGQWSRFFELAFDDSIYRNIGMRGQAECPRIAVYARTHTARRAVELALLALELLARRGIHFHVDLFGDDSNIYSAPFSATNHGILTPGALAELYRAATIGVCFSATNHSLVTQEMMACGLPVVELAGDSTAQTYPNGVATFAAPHPEEIAAAIESLLADSNLRESQANVALTWVSCLSWETSARQVESAISERLEMHGSTIPRTKSVRHCSSVRATVCIPTYNGGSVLLAVIDRILSQRTNWKYKILIADSSSSDGSYEAAKSTPGVQAFQIDKAQFGHGRTRNLLASRAEGEYIVFLTQDAMPANTEWLYNLISVLDRYETAAGAFGRHTARADASPFTKRDIANHFEGFLSYPLNLSSWSSIPSLEQHSLLRRQLLHFFSDNNSCLRRSAWEKIPFRDVSFGEDQLWAFDALSAGYSRAYAPSAVVEHSHDYGIKESEERAFTEALFFSEHFGYAAYSADVSFDDQLAEQNESDRLYAKRYAIDKLALNARYQDNAARLYGRHRAYSVSNLFPKP